MTCVSFVVLLSNAFSTPSNAEDDRGNAQDIFRPLQRIVSLVPAVTEELFLLGMGDGVVGVTVYCQRPSQAEKKNKVGTVIDANVEKILQLQPDLVIASNLADRKQIEKLQSLGIRVKVFSHARDFRRLCEDFLTLARLVGKQEKAQAIVKAAKAELEAIEAGLQRFYRRRVFVQIGANPLFAANGESFIGDLIERAGGVNIASDAKEGIFSREEVISRNPDTILIVNMGIVGTKEKEVWMRYKTVSAVENDRIFTVDSYRVCSPTPVSFVETVKEFVRIFHGER